jgi:hypothetical protein
MDHGEGLDEDAMWTVVRNGQGGDEWIDAWILARHLQEGRMTPTGAIIARLSPEPTAALVLHSSASKKGSGTEKASPLLLLARS